MSKVSNKIRKRCELFSKLITKTPERCQWRRSSVFIVNFEHISHLYLVFLLLTLNKLMLVWLYCIFTIDIVKLFIFVFVLRLICFYINILVTYNTCKCTLKLRICKFYPELVLMDLYKSKELHNGNIHKATLCKHE